MDIEKNNADLIKELDAKYAKKLETRISELDEKYSKYVDARIKELKTEFVKYINYKINEVDSKGKEMVLSDKSMQEIRAEVNQIIRTDVAPVIDQAVAYVQYKTYDPTADKLRHQASVYQQAADSRNMNVPDNQRNAFLAFDEDD